MPINLAQLRAFHMVATQGSFTKAAKALNVTQPTVSGQVGALEEGAGVRLFERQGRGVRLTALGSQLLGVTTRLFALHDEAEELLSASMNLEAGRLAVGADSPFTVMPLLSRLSRRHPGVTFDLTLGNSAEVLRNLYDYRTDVGVLADIRVDPRLIAHPLLSPRVMAFVPRTHPWAREREVMLAAFQDQPMVWRTGGSVTRQVFERALAERAITPAVVMEINTREATREAVAAGFGIGVIAENEFGMDPRLVLLPINDADLRMTIYAVCLRERRRLRTVRAFMDIAQEYAA
ncbi:LysR substrate-binding domain-containing protein [Pararhodospirillum oryzae]|uniref:Transcriptional regulator n=1 Tax=Pararhodospirillum oryzae TaxID=478448 RepID=A0A512H878_9PROT|nr:LysR substrate-binding domain-containing protein [Pararhodospirillum oryzae]GEO81653.1 transcriptional regulator [Pararhodospirillum oryzae]